MRCLGTDQRHNSLSDRNAGFRRTELGFYLQDIYKATPNLTLTLGLRYENFLGWPWTEVADRMYQFVPEKQTWCRWAPRAFRAAESPR